MWGVRGCEGVCGGMRECARVCMGVGRCAQVCSGVGGNAQVCTGVCGCAHVYGMNFQNFFWRIESLHQRTLIRILYEFFISYTM